MDLDRNISEMSEEEIIDFYSDINGELHSFKINLADKLKLRSVLEDIEDIAAERDIDL